MTLREGSLLGHGVVGASITKTAQLDGVSCLKGHYWVALPKALITNTIFSSSGRVHV